MTMEQKLERLTMLGYFELVHHDGNMNPDHDAKEEMHWELRNHTEKGEK